MTPRSVLDDLLERPGGFDFFQAVRLLQRERSGKAPVGRFGTPTDEAVHFGVNPRLSFPASQIQDLRTEGGDGDPWQMTVNFMGLVGHFGVLPHHYSTVVMARGRARDPVLQDFLDLFHHRLLSLFYRAWERYRFFAAWERNEEDPVTAHLGDLLGLHGSVFRPEAGLDPAALVGYFGLLAPHQRSAMALEQVIEDYFGVPVHVEQFVGGWYSMQGSQCTLDDESTDPSGMLGYGALVGDEVWDVQARARVVLGPMRRMLYDRFLPTGDAYGELRGLVRFFSDDQIDFEVRLILDPRDVQPIVLGDDTSPLNWGTWLRSTERAVGTAETILSL